MNDQFLYGLIIGALIAGLLGILVVRNLKQRREILEDSQIVAQAIDAMQPILSLEKTKNGSWYIEAVIGDQEYRRLVNVDVIERIIGDFVAREVSQQYADTYTFDLRCSDGSELSVFMQRKSKIE